jgi:hypothetical protein
MQHRFRRVHVHEDLDPQVAASWHGFDEVFCDGDDVVIVPSAAAARIRIRCVA